MGNGQSGMANQCGICEKVFMGIFDDDIILKCERCGCIYCLICSGLNKSQYETMQESNGSIKWYCQFCVIEIKRNHDVVPG